MRLVQRWRRTALLICFLLCVDALVTLWLDPDLTQGPHLTLVQSLFAFIFAVLIAVNFLTLRLRK